MTDAFLCYLTGEFLYATWDGDRVVEITQHVLPGYVELLSAPSTKELPMKGMWAGERATNADYKPALDGLYATDGTLIRDAIAAAISTGAAISISLTRDYGALVLTLLDGNDRKKIYPTDAQEIAQAFEDLRDSFKPQTPPKAPRSK